MANKAFEIQESKLRIGGLDLEAGATAIAIPGLSQAANYRVEEVDERDGNNPNTFGSNTGAVTVIDNSRYLELTGTTPSASYVPAEYSVDELDDGEIEEINVEVEGVFESSDKTRAEASNMWATTVVNPFVSFSAGNWTQIPFRPKVRAGEVENIGGGGTTLPSQSGQSGKFLTTDGEDLSWATVSGNTDLGDFSIDGSELSADSMTIKTVNGDITIESDSSVLVDVAGGTKRWSFANDGNLTLPEGGDIVDSNGTSVLGGGSVGSGVVFREVEFPLGAPGDTQGTIAVNAAGETFIAIADYDAGAVPTFTVQQTTGSGGGGQSQIYVDLRDYADLLAYLQEIGTPSNDLSPGDSEVSFDGGDNWFEISSYTGLTWEQDPPFLSLGFTGPQPEVGDEVIIRWPTDVVNVWIKPNMGDLTITADNLTGEADVQITAGDDIRIYANDDISLRTYSTDNGGGSVTISTNYNEDTEKTWEFTNDGNLDLPAGGEIRFSYGYIDQDTEIQGNALRISGGNSVVIKTDEDGKTWEFDYRGALRLPEGGDILDSNGDSVLGGGSGATTVARQDTPPATGNGTLWFNTVEGRLYIKYSDAWVDAAPLVMPAPDTDIDVASITFPDATVQTSAFSNKLVNGVHEVVLGANGTLTLPQGGDIVDSNGNSVLGGGDSAYQLAVNNGFIGSESAWLASLKGEPGERGETGADGAPGANGLDGAPGLNGLDGAPGANGLDGAPGLNGLDGAPGANGLDGAPGATGKGFIIAKTYASLAALEADTAPADIVAGEFAIIDSNEGDPDNSKLYLWTGSTYNYVMDLSGAQGIQGTNGEDGDSAYQVAVTNGFGGTEQDWLDSLVGSTTITNNYPAFTNVLATINKTGGTVGTPTAIDLTQFVNKLSSDNNGRYTLANGVEGQLMYLTRQGTSNIQVTVANARINGNLNTNEDLTFSSGVITLLFTDGYWQQSGGEWPA